MKKILNLAIGLCALAFANSSKAEVQIVETLMMFKVNGVDTYRQGDRADQGTFFNPRLSIAGLGTTNFNPGAGDSLVLDRVYLKTNAWDGGNTPDGGGAANNWLNASNWVGLNYSITPTGGADSWQYIRANNVADDFVDEWSSVSRVRNAGNTDWVYSSGNHVNLLAGLAQGTYTFKYYFDVEYNSWTGTAAVIGHTYDAVGVQAGAGNAPNLANASSTTFNVIPEPSSSLLMGLGLAGLAVLRRTRKDA